MAMKHLIKTRTYRERSQPGARQHLGMLEKHKDYVLRAKDFHRKEDTLQKLREKASFRNPDEYYMKMAHTKTEGGVHRKRAAENPTQDEMKAFKKEDANYLMVKQTAEAKKVERLRADLHMLDAPLQNKHTVFVSDAASARALDASGHGSTPAETLAVPPVRPKKVAKRARATEGAAGSSSSSSSKQHAFATGGGDDDDADSDDEDGGEEQRRPAGGRALPKKAQAKLDKARAAKYAELEQREQRHAKMGQALRRIGIEKALMGKGARKKLKPKEEGGPKVFKWKQRRSK
jgi:U3 small nucleolar RNA-associated protein 11